MMMHGYTCGTDRQRWRSPVTAMQVNCQHSEAYQSLTPKTLTPQWRGVCTMARVDSCMACLLKCPRSAKSASAPAMPHSGL